MLFYCTKYWNLNEHCSKKYKINPNSIDSFEQNTKAVFDITESFNPFVT